MPLLASRTTVPVAAGCEPIPLGLTYIDPDGEAWLWSDDTRPVMAEAVAGIGSPPVSLASTPLPGGGAVPQSMTAQARPVVIALHVAHDDQAEFLRLLDRLSRALWTVRADAPAPGTLVVARPDGTSRQLRVLVTDGPDQGDDDRTKSTLLSTRYVITLQALDPFWEDSQPRSLEFRAPPASGGVPPMPPVALTPSTVLGQAMIINSGDADAWPVWTITGPGTPTLSNTTTGRTFGLDAALASGESVTVDTRPARQSAVDNTQANRWGDLVRSSPRDLWSLVPGINTVNLTLAGASAGSAIRMTYTRRWLRA